MRFLLLFFPLFCLAQSLFHLSDHFREFDAKHMVLYMEARELQRYKVNFINGRMHVNGKIFNTTIQSDTKRAASIFTMNWDGQLYISNDYRYEEFHHTSLSAGAPVKSAGEMIVIDGVPVRISNRSGHYRPSIESLDLVITRMKNMGAELIDDLRPTGFSAITLKAHQIGMQIKDPCSLAFQR